jgi:L-threonylcarbamoyladenylate synthase
MIKKNEIIENKDFYINEIKNWKIFIYPTDTVLWIWCNSSVKESVAKIYDIKKRENKPFLQIIPNIDWLVENCEISENNLEKIKQKLPWPYSFIVKQKNINKTIWIRIPKCRFYNLIKESWECFITTSVNFAWEKPSIKVSEIPMEMLKKVDYVIDDDESLSWISSTLIDLTWKEEIIIKRK